MNLVQTYISYQYRKSSHWQEEEVQVHHFQIEQV